MELWFWKMPGDQPVHRGSMQPPFLPSQLAAAGIPTALQHTPTKSSTEQGSLVRVAEPKPWPGSPPEASHNVSAVLTVVCLWARI